MPFAIPITQPGKTPAYTADDARTFIATFVAAHPRADLYTVSGAPFTIDDARFVTREQAEEIMRGESLAGQAAPGDLVCVVSLTGPFTGETISIMPGAKRRTWHPTHITLVFDVHTGNLLTEWFHD